MPPPPGLQVGGVLFAILQPGWWTSYSVRRPGHLGIAALLTYHDSSLEQRSKLSAWIPNALGIGAAGRTTLPPLLCGGVVGPSCEHGE